MKNIFRFYAYPRRRRHRAGEAKRLRVRLPMGWAVKTQWKRQVRFKRFWDEEYSGDVYALRAAIDWLLQQNREMGKPTTENVIRSFGAYGTRNGKVGKWRR